MDSRLKAKGFLAAKPFFAIATATAIAATSPSKLPKLHKIPVQNLKKLQKFANLPRIFLETGNSQLATHLD